ncbi:MAG: hypothetical protein QOD05_1153 [Microbacteriaceae bacterium]|jgi:hypothetical protein|nr:hypothetical protein [Microbacteriaceae bacterium]
MIEPLVLTFEVAATADTLLPHFVAAAERNG